MPFLSFPQLDIMPSFLSFVPLIRKRPHITCMAHCPSIRPPSQCAMCVTLNCVIPCVSSPWPLAQKAGALSLVFSRCSRGRLFSLSLTLEYHAFRTLSATWCNATHTEAAGEILASSECVSSLSLPSAWGLVLLRALHGLFHFGFQMSFLSAIHLTISFLFESRRWNSLASISYYPNLAPSLRTGLQVFFFLL